jgi:hypothetical protein
MIGKILGAFLGGKVAQHTRGIEGPTGAALGVLAPAILRRLSWPAIAALGVGGYLAKRMADRGSQSSTDRSADKRSDPKKAGAAYPAAKRKPPTS